MNDNKSNLIVSAIIQARFGSTRLPGKILMPLVGKPILWHLNNRLSHSKFINKVIVATTIQPEDNEVQKFCEENNIIFFRGSSENVLSRYYEAAKIFNADMIIRITADCPLIDPVIIDRMLEKYFLETEKDKFEYWSNVQPRTFPRGLDVELFSFASLEKTYREADQQYELEHVTPYMYQHPEIFTLKSFTNNIDYSFHRWTIDTPEDYNLIKNIYDGLYQKKNVFLFDDILKLFADRPELLSINQNIKQKGLRE